MHLPIFLHDGELMAPVTMMMCTASVTAASPLTTEPPKMLHSTMAPPNMDFPTMVHTTMEPLQFGNFLFCMGGYGLIVSSSGVLLCHIGCVRFDGTVHTWC